MVVVIFFGLLGLEHVSYRQARYAMTVGYCTIQLGASGCYKSPSRSRAEPWWGPGGEASGSSKESASYSA